MFTAPIGSDLESWHPVYQNPVKTSTPWKNPSLTYAPISIKPVLRNPYFHPMSQHTSKEQILVAAAVIRQGWKSRVGATLSRWLRRPNSHSPSLSLQWFHPTSVRLSHSTPDSTSDVGVYRTSARALNLKGRATSSFLESDHTRNARSRREFAAALSNQTSTLAKKTHNQVPNRTLNALVFGFPNRDLLLCDSECFIKFRHQEKASLASDLCLHSQSLETTSQSLFREEWKILLGRVLTPSSAVLQNKFFGRERGRRRASIARHFAPSIDVRPPWLAANPLAKPESSKVPPGLWNKRLIGGIDSLGKVWRLVEELF